MKSHLKQTMTDEMLSDLLASPGLTGQSSEDAELLELKAALRSYRTETLDWAERRSATQPSLAAKARESRWVAVPQWSLAAVAVVAVAAGVVHVAGYGVEDAASSAAVTTHASSIVATSADDIAADNQLLGSIDQALRYERTSPVSEFHEKHAKTSKKNTHDGVSE